MDKVDSKGKVDSKTEEARALSKNNNNFSCPSILPPIGASNKKNCGCGNGAQPPPTSMCFVCPCCHGQLKHAREAAGCCPFSGRHGSTSSVQEDIKDPNSDPDNPQKLRFEDVKVAAATIRDCIAKTPFEKSQLTGINNMEIYLKKEFLHYTRSFKERGARFALMMLPPERQRCGVVTASTGNHASALAYHGSLLKVPVIVIMPVTAQTMKRMLCEALGAKVIMYGNQLSESKSYGLKLAQERCMIYINGFDHPHVLAGQGSIGLEILEQVPDVDAILCPVGSGSMISGVATVVKCLCPRVKVYAIESDQCTGWSTAVTSGGPTPAVCNPSVADGLSVTTVGVNTFVTACPLLERSITVSESSIMLAMLRLAEIEKCICEGAGAVPLAAILENKVPELRGKKVVVMCSGGNIDTPVYIRVLERALAIDGRLWLITVTISDQGCALAELTKQIGSLGINIKELFQERMWLKDDLFDVQVRCVIETRDKEHCCELESLLRRCYKDVQVGKCY